MEIAALLTGKKNSSFKNKNRLIINGKPIFAYPAIIAKKSKIINRFYASSDSNYILNYCHKLNYKRIKRPKNLCAKNSLHKDVLVHAINLMKKEKFFPDIIIVLLANAPVIKKKWIEDCIKILKRNKNLTAVVPVTKNNDYNPLRSKKIKNNLLFNYIKTKKKIPSNRQELENSYFLCHNFWVIKCREIFKDNGQPPWNFMGKKVKPYVIENSIDIHDKFDYELAKIIIDDLKIKI